MRHEIETTAPTHSTAAITRLAQICDQISAEHETRAEINTAGPMVRIIAHCNGAALRDLVSDLDRAGFLD